MRYIHKTTTVLIVTVSEFLAAYDIWLKAHPDVDFYYWSECRENPPMLEDIAASFFDGLYTDFTNGKFEHAGGLAEDFTGHESAMLHMLLQKPYGFSDVHFVKE